MTIQCGWCGVPMGEKPGPVGVSHGMCPACSVTFLAESVVQDVERTIEETARTRRAV